MLMWDRAGRARPEWAPGLLQPRAQAQVQVLGSFQLVQASRPAQPVQLLAEVMLRPRRVLRPLLLGRWVWLQPAQRAQVQQRRQVAVRPSAQKRSRTSPSAGRGMASGAQGWWRYCLVQGRGLGWLGTVHQ